MTPGRGEWKFKIILAEVRSLLNALLKPSRRNCLVSFLLKSLLKIKVLKRESFAESG